jgi:murein DD-endopeptidase MepM/ murein hydrolase activator NlpD
MRLKKILARVKMGDRTYFSADGYLQSVKVSLGEGDRSSTCNFSISDPKLKVGQALFAQSFDTGGIEVPPDLLQAPPPPPSASGSEGGQIFEDLSDLPGDGQLIINECGKQGIRDIPSIAYIMATVQRETGTYKPIPEIGGPNARYAPYYGRGYVQLTWDFNYAKYSKITGKDLVGNPDLVLEPALAAFILVHGFLTGTFTDGAHKLRDHISADGSKKDFMNARRIINGTDVASLIAGYAQEWEKKLEGLKLKKGGAGASDKDEDDTPSSPASVPEPVTTSPPAPGEIADKADSAPVEISEKGTEIIVGLGEDFDSLTDFHFIHTGTTVQVRPSSVSIKGQCIRWLLARRKQNTTYQDITLRELAELVCERMGLVLEMEGDGPRFAFLDQSGLSDFGLLKRECDAVGFLIQDRTDNRLIITPMRPDFTGFVIQPWMIHESSLQFADEASGDMPANRKPSGGGTEVKAEIKPESGEIVQVREEDSRGTMEEANEGDAMGVTGPATPSIYGTIAVSNDAAGLPTQETGAIALANNEEVAAEALKEEVQRVQGWPGSVTLKMTGATLSLVPGNIIAISPDCAGGVFAREWRLGTVAHSVQAEGPSTTELTFYTPQESVPKKEENSSGSGGSSGGGETSDQTVGESGWLRPSSGVLTSDYLSRNARRPNHHGVDISAGEGSPIFCAYDGVVVDVEPNCQIGDQRCGGGFGTLVFVESGQYTHYYCHMQPGVTWKVGDQIKQGELVGKESDTGASRGAHLHFQIMQGGQSVDPAQFIKL